MSAYVTHGVFPKQSWNKFKADNGGESQQGEVGREWGLTISTWLHL